MISKIRDREAEKQGTPMTSPPMPSKHLPIYLHLVSSGDSHGLYYVIEEKGDSPSPQYRRPRVETSDSEEDSEYALPILNRNRDKEVEVELELEGEDEDDEDYQDTLKEAEEEAKVEALFHGCPDPFGSDSGEVAKAKALFHGVPTYIPSARLSDDDSEAEAKGEALYCGVGSDSEEESPPKKSKLEQVEDQNRQIENYSKKTNEGEILVINNSETDKIRPLQFPDFPFVPFASDLLLVGERFYFIGGYNVLKSQCGYDDDFPPLTNMFVWDSDVDKYWKSLPGPNIVSYTVHHPTRKAAVWAGGTLFVIGDSFKQRRTTFLGLSSGDTAWKTVPPLPAIYISIVNNISPLAVNGSKIFFQVNGAAFLARNKNRPVHLAAYFDVKSWEWEIVGKWFTGIWSPGVVIFDAYLFSYGKREQYQKKSYICVYSIERQCWLRRPVRGLKRDGNVLPDDGENLSGVAAYLFQVNDNVLAFVWSRPPAIRLKEEKDLSDVHCTKFVLHSIKDPKKKHPVFQAEVISYGSWLVEGYELQNCLVKQSATT